MNKRAAITGIGIISPIGIGHERFWRSITEGQTGFSKLSPHLMDKSLKIDYAAEVRDFSPGDILGEKGLRTYDRNTKFVLAATKLAIDETRQDDVADWGVVIGTMFGSLASICGFDRESLVEGPNYVNPALFPNTVINSPPSHANIRFGIKRLSTTIASGFTAGLDALIYGASMIENGMAGSILAGGSEELSLEELLGFQATIQMSRDNHLVCGGGRGTILGEGAAIIALTGDECDRKMAEIMGFSSRFSPEGLIKKETVSAVLGDALAAAGCDADDIGLIVTGANGCSHVDEAELQGIYDIFGDNPMMCAPKANLGEQAGAAGAFQVAVAAMSLDREIVPPTPNFAAGKRFSDKQTAIMKTKALVLNTGCNGNCSCLILTKPNGRQ